MRTRIASLLLMGTGMALSFVCVVVAWFVPRAFYIMYQPKSFDEVWKIMPAITRTATHFSWAFVVLIAAMSIASIVCMRRFPERVVEHITAGLCVQGMVAWSGMFCFFFDGFTGPMSLHHGPKFELSEFVSFGFGVFPVTLLSTIALFIMALWSRGTSKT